MKKLDMINEKLSKGREKLEEIKKQYDTDSKKITELIQVKAGLLADEIIESSPERKKKISDLNKELDSLRKNVESSGPELIDALQKKIQEIQSEKTNEELKIAFENQKRSGTKIVDLSEKLIESLGQANSINEQLNKAWNEYSNLSKMTKRGAIKPGAQTCRPSQESLKALIGILNYEYKEGKPRPRNEFSRIPI